jgi:hypothetical protein
VQQILQQKLARHVSISCMGTLLELMD